MMINSDYSGDSISYFVLGKFDHDLTVHPHWELCFFPFIGNNSQMALGGGWESETSGVALIQLSELYNLPRILCGNLGA